MSSSTIGGKAERAEPLKTRYQIGCKTAPMNYPGDQQVFHIKDIPADKLAAKKTVQRSLESNILSTAKPNWNGATSTGEKICSRRTYVNSVLNRSDMFVYNYRAEVLPSSYPLLHPRSNKFNTGILEVTLAQVDQGETFNDKRIAMGISKQIQELPNHPDLIDKVRWNISSDLKDPIHEQQFLASEQARVKNSRIKNDLLVPGRVPIIEQYKQGLEQQRKTILSEKYSRQNALTNMKASQGLFDRLEAQKLNRSDDYDSETD